MLVLEQLKKLNIEYYNKVIDINNLNDFKKLSIYMKYVIVQLCMKKDTFYNFSDLHIKTFEEFFSLSNIIILDVGEDYYKYNYAQRYRIELLGVFQFINKHKLKI
jgi:hypothetical protein